MNWKKRVLNLLALLLIGGFLALFPGYARERAKVLQAEEKPFSGILSVWHIVGFKTYQGSVSGWLSQCAERFEKAHGGVFVEVLSMTQEECAARLARGEQADLLCFPSGWCDPDALLPLSAPNAAYAPGLLESGAWEGEQYAVPLLLSGYALVGSQRVLQERGAQLPERADGPALQTLAEKLTDTGRKTQMQGLAGDAVFSALLGLELELAAPDAFRAGGAALALADLRAAGDCRRLEQAGKGFAAEFCLLDTNYTDLVQYAGLARGVQAEKIPLLTEYLAVLLDEKQQGKLYALGAFPAAGVPEDAAMEDAFLAAMAERMKAPAVPNAFLYQRYRGAMEEEAARALAGDAQAKKALRARAEELVENRAQMR